MNGGLVEERVPDLTNGRKFFSVGFYSFFFSFELCVVVPWLRGCHRESGACDWIT
jgi:hypothetical protein